jgi:hypothetical protein
MSQFAAILRTRTRRGLYEFADAVAEQVKVADPRDASTAARHP